MEKREKIILLETVENLRKINPWRIDIKKELDKVYNLLRNYFSLIIAGLAADNAAYVYVRKLDEIERVLEKKELRSDGEKIELSNIPLPNVDIRYTPQKYMVDISELIEQLNEIIEREISKRMERNIVEIEVEDLRKKLEEKLQAAREFILHYLSRENTAILFTDLAKIGSKQGISPLYILYAILFLAQEDIIEVDILENEGYVEEIIITKRGR